MPEPSPPAAAGDRGRSGLASTLSAMLALQIGVVVVAALYVGRDVLIPVTIAVLLSFILSPVVHLLRQIHLGRIPSILVAVVVGLSVLLAISYVVGTQITDVAAKIPEYASTIERKVATVRAHTIDRVSGLMERAGHLANPEKGNESQPGAPAGAPQPPRQNNQPPGDQQGNQQQQGNPPAQNPQPVANILSFVEQYLPTVLSPFASAGIVLFVAIFILVQKEDLRDRLIRIFGARDLHRTTAAIDDAAQRLSRFFLSQVALNTAFAVVIGIGLTVIGVPNPLLWAVLSGVFRFVPYIGAILSAALPIGLAAAVDPGWVMALSTLALYGVVEVLVSQVAEPIVYGHSTGLSPFAVVVSAIFWTWIWGPIGLVLSTPMTLCLVVLGRHIERLEVFDVLLGDQPALTPVESFYQRILAGDVDEVEDQAEALLKTISLSSYYDQVALEGMKLAASDLDRGVLTDAQLDRVNATIKTLVDELASYDDTQPEKKKERKDDDKDVAPEPGAEIADGPLPRHLPDPDALLPAWRGGESPVLCLAGRGPLDEAASAMLCQLLEKHGIGARLAPYEAASREQIERLSADGIAMVCVSYLHLANNPPHLRYLVRRLRRKLPNAAIMVGLWPTNDRLNDEQKRLIGAGWYINSLKQAVETCLSQAIGAPPQPALAADRLVSDAPPTVPRAPEVAAPA